MYYVIKSGEDGCKVSCLTKEELVNNLNEKYWGDVKYLEKFDTNDPNYWGESILIIKGEAIVPKSVKIVESYTVK